MKHTLIDSHRFFIKESPKFMEGTSRIKYYLRYPIAYIKFMWYSYHDFKHFVKYEK